MSSGQQNHRSVSFNATSISNTNEQEIAKKLMTETTCEDGQSVWQATIETFMMQDSRGVKGDFYCEFEDEGLACLSAMVNEKDINIDVAPLIPFNATIDDLLRVFIKWCRLDEENMNTHDKIKQRYNVSKAFRRVVIYVQWLNKNCRGFDYNPTTMKKSYDAWGFFLTHDKLGRLVWWSDVDQNLFDEIRNEISYDDTLRYFTYLSHFFMFDHGAQENGMVCVDQMGNKSAIEYFSWIPMDLGVKLDRITVGILPIKMKKMYHYNCARWMWFVAGLMAPFASSKVRNRMCVIRGNPQKRFEEDLGINSIPTKMSGVRGLAETCILMKAFSNGNTNNSMSAKYGVIRDNLSDDGRVDRNNSINDAHTEENMSTSSWSMEND